MLVKGLFFVFYFLSLEKLSTGMWITGLILLIAPCVKILIRYDLLSENVVQIGSHDDLANCVEYSEEKSKLFITLFSLFLAFLRAMEIIELHFSCVLFLIAIRTQDHCLNASKCWHVFMMNVFASIFMILHFN